MGVAIFPQAVVSPRIYDQLVHLMDEAGGVAFRDGYPSGSDPHMGDGWFVGTTHEGQLWPSKAAALAALGVTYISVPADHAKLNAWPAMWTEHDTIHGTQERRVAATLPSAIDHGWFDSAGFSHGPMLGHKVLAAEAAGGVLPRTFPHKAHLAW